MARLAKSEPLAKSNMSDTFYKVVRAIGRPVFWSSSRSLVLGAEHVPSAGPCLIAATHQSPYDVPVLVLHTPRLLDFVSMKGLFQNPVIARLLGSMNAFPLDRSSPDLAAVRVILSRLRASRAVAIFPEGRLRPGATSVVHTGKLKAGCGRIAKFASAPVVPCVMIGTEAYRTPLNWLPIGRARYGIIYGTPIDPSLEPPEIEARLVRSMVLLHEQLRETMNRHAS